MLFSQLLSTVSMLAVFICCLLAAFLVIAPSERRLANRLFAMFLFLTAIDVSGWLWEGEDLSILFLDAIRQSLSFLQMPLFVGFIAATCYSDFKLTKWDILHLLPFVLALCLVLPGNQWPLLGTDPGSGHTYLSRSEQMAYFIGAHLQYYLYIAVALRMLLRFRRIFRRYYSDTQSVVFRWLSQLVVVSLFAHTLVLVRALTAAANAEWVFMVLQVIGALIVLFVVTWITLKALLQPQIFKGVDRALDRASDKVRNESVQTAVDDEKERLQLHMETAKPYLDPTLNLPLLADQLGVLPRDLSELINQMFGSHFFDFVNRYRISKAKEMLLENPDMSILRILNEVGFNSKSSFNSAFKKHTQTTPSAYRRSHLS